MVSPTNAAEAEIDGTVIVVVIIDVIMTQRRDASELS